MNASGLMIGNYLKNEGIVVKIDARSIFDMFNDNPKYTPITLTDEWFIKLGFEMSSTGFIEKGRLLYHKEYGWKILENWVKGWVGVAEIIYVHQLQNLYYAITGEELTAEPARPTIKEQSIIANVSVSLPTVKDVRSKAIEYAKEATVLGDTCSYQYAKKDFIEGAEWMRTKAVGN